MTDVCGIIIIVVVAIIVEAWGAWKLLKDIKRS